MILCDLIKGADKSDPNPNPRPTLGALIDSGAAVGAGTGELLGLGDRPTAVRASDPDVVGRTMEAEAGR